VESEANGNYPADPSVDLKAYFVDDDLRRRELFSEKLFTT